MGTKIIVLVLLAIIISSIIGNSSLNDAGAEQSVFETIILSPEQDSFLAQGNAKQNEGDNPILQIISSDKKRPVIAFNQSEIQTALVDANLEYATLRLYILDNGNNWGPDGRNLVLHSLTQNWTEGNGWNTGNTISGNGSGVTWNCPIDTDISNNQDDCTEQWNGGSFTSTATDTVLITNDMMGQFIEFDVTSDIQSFLDGTQSNFGWITKKGDESLNGSLDFASKESENNIPQLVLVVSPKVTWIPDTVNLEARSLANIPLNFTVGKFVSEADVFVSSEIQDLVIPNDATLSNLDSGITHTLPVTIIIPADTVSGWHNGTISLSSNSTQLQDSLDLNILVPEITTEVITTPEGNFTTVATPSFSDFAEDTYDVSIYFTFNNGTTILLHTFYDIFADSSGVTPTSFDSPNYFEGLVFTISESLNTIHNALFTPFASVKDASAIIVDPVESECTRYAMTYHFEQFTSSNANDFAVAKDAISASDRNPLIIRNDIRWVNLDNGKFVNGVWEANFTHAGSKITNYFNTLPSDAKAIVILGVQDPPVDIASVAPLAGGRTSAHYLFQGNADDFVEFTVNYIKNNGLLDRVEFWQIDNEPNVQVPLDLVSFGRGGIIKSKANWDAVSSGLAKWSTTIRQIDPDTPIIVNVYQTSDRVIPKALIDLGIIFGIEPFNNILKSNSTAGQQIVSNINMMGFDIYPDNWVLPRSDDAVIDGFNATLSQVNNQLVEAKDTFGFTGDWGLTEIAAGPKARWQGLSFTPFVTENVTSSDVYDQINIARESHLGGINGQFPSLIAPFQVRAPNAGVNAGGPPFGTFDDAYGLITNGTGLTNSDFFNTIQSSVQQNCPGEGPNVVDQTTTAISPAKTSYYSGEKRIIQFGSTIFAFYYDGSNIVYKSSTDNGNNWGTKQSVGTGVLDSDFVRWTIGTDNSNHIVVLYNTPSGTLTQFKAISGTVSGSTIVFDAPKVLFSEGPDHRGRISAGTDTNGNIHAAFRWDDGSTHRMRIYQSPDGGSTWTLKLSASTGVFRTPIILTPLDSGKMLFVQAFFPNNDLFFRIFDGSSWGGLQQISNVYDCSNCFKQLSGDSDSTNSPSIAFLSNANSGDVRVAKWNSNGQFIGIETAEGTLSHSLASLTISDDDVTHVYSISNDIIYETINDGSWQAPTTPFGTTFVNPNQLTSAIDIPAALWVEGTSSPFDVKFGRTSSSGLTSASTSSTSSPVVGGPYFDVQINQTSVNATKPTQVTIPLKVEWLDGYYAEPLDIELFIGNGTDIGIYGTVTSVQNATLYKLFDLTFDISNLAQVGEENIGVLVTELESGYIDWESITFNISE